MAKQSSSSSDSSSEEDAPTKVAQKMPPKPSISKTLLQSASLANKKTSLSSIVSEDTQLLQNKLKKGASTSSSSEDSDESTQKITKLAPQAKTIDKHPVSSKKKTPVKEVKNEVSSSSEESEEEPTKKLASLEEIASPKRTSKSPEKKKVPPKPSSSKDSSDDEASASKRVNVQQNIVLKADKTLDEKISDYHPQGKRVSFSDEVEDLVFSDFDNHFILQVPLTINPKKLKKISINLNNPHGSLLTYEQDCELKAINTLGEKSLVVGQVPRLLKFNATLGITRHLSNTVSQEETQTKATSTTVPLPENLKVRHPLFGKNYEGKIHVDSRTKQKMDESIANAEERRKVKSKKKKHKKELEDTNNSDEMIYQLLKTKTDLIEDEEAEVKTSKKSKKAKKHKLESNEEMNSKKPRNNSASEPEPTLEETHKKKKKKHKKQEEQEASIKETGSSQEFTEPVKKKKKHKHSKSTTTPDRQIANSTLMSGILKTPKFHETEAILPETIEKPQKSAPLIDPKRLLADVFGKKEKSPERTNNVEPTMSSPKKKKRKESTSNSDEQIKKRKDSLSSSEAKREKEVEVEKKDALISSLLSNVTSMLIQPKKKKKKERKCEINN